MSYVKQLLFRMMITGLFILLGVGCLQSREMIMVKSATGQEYDVPALGIELAEYDVVFFGELHGNAFIHALEAAILPYFQQAAPQVAISLEMLERDVQDLLDEYLAGRVELEEFLQGARPWSNYLADYHPLIEFARLQALPVIAANVPRVYASLVARNGATTLDTLSAGDKEYIARQLIIFKDSYWDKFAETMTGLGERHMIFDEQQLDNLYAAQCLKDDTMAEAIADFLEAKEGWKVIHYNGHFHSSEHLGTVQKLSLIRPDLRIAVLSPVITDLEAWQENLDQYKHLGEYLILLADEDSPEADGN